MRNTTNTKYRMEKWFPCYNYRRGGPIENSLALLMRSALFIDRVGDWIAWIYLLFVYMWQFFFCFTSSSFVDTISILDVSEKTNRRHVNRRLHLDIQTVWMFGNFRCLCRHRGIQTQPNKGRLCGTHKSHTYTSAFLFIITINDDRCCHISLSLSLPVTNYSIGFAPAYVENGVQIITYLSQLMRTCILSTLVFCNDGRCRCTPNASMRAWIGFFIPEGRASNFGSGSNKTKARLNRKWFWRASA